MILLPEVIIAILTPFAPFFTRPVWSHAQVLLIGAMLCRGPCTVAAVLRVMWLGAEKRHDTIDSLTSKVVLFLGRFGGGGLEVLRQLREGLQEAGYVPMIFEKTFSQFRYT
jgi:hypothetical protein